jgi:hypothetical protein
MTLEELLAKRERLVASLASPRRLQAGDLVIEHHDPSTIQRAIAAIDAEISRLESPKNRLFTIQTKRGL